MKKVIFEHIIPSLILEEQELSKPVLPKFIVKALKDNKTSLGAHPAFPPDDDKTFIEKVVLKRFDEITNDLNQLDDEDKTEDFLSKKLSELLLQCKKLEEPIKETLEKICFNFVTEFFGVPNDIVIFSCELVDKVKPIEPLRLLPEDTDEMEFDGIEELEGLNDDVYKRRLIDSLIQGASVYYSDIYDKFVGEIFKLNSKLPALYHDIITINNYLIFVKKEKMDDKRMMQGGCVDVILGNESTKSEIKSQALILPILLAESIKGFMELFASHGLPDSKEKALFVLKKADFLLAEPWDTRLGVVLWKLFIESLGNIDSTLIPSIFSYISSLNTKEFNRLFKEIFAKTKKSKIEMAQIRNKVIKEKEKNDFETGLMKKRTDSSMIADEFMTIDDLI